MIARAEALLLLTDANTVRVAGSTPLAPRTTAIVENWQRRWHAAALDWSAAFIRGRHEAVRRWRREAALEKTRRLRPDLLKSRKQEHESPIVEEVC